MREGWGEGKLSPASAPIPAFPAEAGKEKNGSLPRKREGEEQQPSRKRGKVKSGAFA